MLAIALQQYLFFFKIILSQFIYLDGDLCKVCGGGENRFFQCISGDLVIGWPLASYGDLDLAGYLVFGGGEPRNLGEIDLLLGDIELRLKILLRIYPILCQGQLTVKGSSNRMLPRFQEPILGQVTLRFLESRNRLPSTTLDRNIKKKIFKETGKIIYLQQT